jgi:hypothetical protein
MLQLPKTEVILNKEELTQAKYIISKIESIWYGK